MSFARIRPRRGTKNQWSIANTILSEGELGIECPNTGVGTGEIKIKIGDGVTPWNDLPYAYDYEASKSSNIDIVESTTITEPGKVMDGKVVSEALADLNNKTILDYYNIIEVKSNQSIKSGTSVITAPSNGILYMKVSIKANGYYGLYFLVNGIEVIGAYNNSIGTNSIIYPITLHLNKGDIVTTNKNMDNDTFVWSYCFVPFKS